MDVMQQLVAERPRARRLDRADVPRLLLIADGFVSGRAGLSAEGVCEHVAALVEAGVSAVQLRDHTSEPKAFETVARALAARLRALRPGVFLAVNDHPALARDLGAVYHVGHRGPAVEEARRLAGPDGLLSYSAHSPTDAHRAAEAGADLLLVSPLFRTVTHPDEPPGEIDLLRRTSTALKDFSPAPPLFGLGGVTPELVADCLGAGAHGVAVLSGLLEAADPQAAARAYLDAFPS